MPLTSRDRVGSRSDRRRELVATGVEILRRSGLEDIDAATVAAESGVSKPLVYYYFPTQRDLQAAVVGEAAHALVATLRQTAQGLSGTDQLLAAIDAAIAFIEQQPGAYTALVRGSGYHPRLGEVFEATRDAVADLLAERMGLPGLTPAQRIAVRSWIALVEEAVLHWLVADRPVPRADLVAYCGDIALHIFASPLAGLPLPESPTG